MNLIKLFFIFFLCFNCVYAQDIAPIDEDVADSLKIEANHDINRLKSFKSEINNNKIYDNEREKALGEFLEDQEKWDLLRERGLRDYRKQKREYLTPTESSPEYREYLKQAAKIQQDYEKSRVALVRTRDRILSSRSAQIVQLEADELQLYSLRPRYELMKRSRNKWVASSSKSGLGVSSGSGGYVPPPPPISNDYPPPSTSDFPAAPAPYEGFEELPPPPVYDSNINNGVPYDPTFSGDMSIPPPPPPPPDYDF